MRSLLIVPMAASVMFAAVNTCPNQTSSASVSSNGGGTSTTQTIPGAPGAPPPPAANDLNSLGASGCTAVDLSFTNFNNSTFTGAGSLAGTYLAETPAGTLAGNDTLLFAEVRGTATDTDGSANDGVNNWVVTHGGTPIVDNINFNITNSGNNAGEAINSVVLNAFGPTIDSSTSGSIIIYICEGTHPTGQITTAAACTAAGGTGFVTQTLTLSTTATSLPLSIPLSAFPSALDITASVNLTNNGGNNHFAGLDAFSLTFDEGVPEPSTFVLLGTALAALAVAGFVRRNV